MRLAHPVYESVPFVYAAIGGAASLIAYVDPVGPASVVAGAIGVVAEVAALTVFLRRLDSRALRQEYTGETIELPSRL